MERKARPRHIQCETTRHAKTFYYYRVKGLPRVRLDGEYGSSPFWASYAAAAAGLSTDERLKNKRFSDIAAKVRRALAAAKHRAAKRGLPFELTERWALDKIERQEFKCALTGIPFFAKHPALRVHPYSPSFDRIDCAGGYTMDNVRIVVFAINVMLSDWGEEVFRRVSDDYSRFRKAHA